MNQQDKLAVIQAAAELSEKPENLKNNIRTVLEALGDSTLWPEEPKRVATSQEFRT